MIHERRARVRYRNREEQTASNRQATREELFLLRDGGVLLEIAVRSGGLDFGKIPWDTSRRIAVGRSMDEAGIGEDDGEGVVHGH